MFGCLFYQPILKGGICQIVIYKIQGILNSGFFLILFSDTKLRVSKESLSIFSSICYDLIFDPAFLFS